MSGFIIRMAFSLCFATVVTSGYSQGSSMHLWFKPGPNDNGLTPVEVNFSYRFVNALGTIMLIYEGDCKGALEYQYKGRTYLFSGMQEGIRQVRPVDPLIDLDIEGPEGMRKNIKVMVHDGIRGGALSANSTTILFEAKTDAQRNMANYRIVRAQVISVRNTNTDKVVSEIEEKLRLEELNKKLAQLKSEAFTAENQNKLELALSKYQSMLSLDDKNSFARDKIEKLKQKMEDKSASEKYNRLMKEAMNAETSNNLPLAEQYYREAANVPVATNYGKSSADRVREKIKQKEKAEADKDKQKKEEEEKKNKESEKASSDKGGSSKKVEDDHEKEREENDRKERKKREEEKNKPQDEAMMKLQVKAMRARSLEKEGDDLYKLGTFFYPQALAKYEEANKIIPLESVTAKINNLNSLFRTAKALNDANNKLNDAISNKVDELDPHRKTDYSYAYLEYNGLMSGRGQTNSLGINNNSSDFYVGITGQRLLFSAQMRFGVSQSDNVEYSVRKYSKTYQTETVLTDRVLLRSTAFSLGFSAGINLPLNNFQVFGLFGYDLRVDLSSTLTSSVYRDSETNGLNMLLPMLQRRIQTGFQYRIPKSAVGFGLNYNFLSLKPSQDKSNSGLIKINKTALDNYENNLFYMNKAVATSYKFNNLGVKFFWMIN